MVKIPPASAAVAGLMPGSGRSPGEENVNPLQYSCWENPMDRESILADCSPQGHKESDTTELLSIHARKHADKAGGPRKRELGMAFLT